MGVAEKVKAKATAYFGEQPDLAEEAPSTLLVDKKDVEKALNAVHDGFAGQLE